MLETGQLYLCPAKKLDDQFECVVSVAKNIVLEQPELYILEIEAFIKETLKPYIAGEVPRVDFLSFFDEGKLNKKKFVKLAENFDSNIEEKSINMLSEFMDSVSSIDNKVFENIITK